MKLASSFFLIIIASTAVFAQSRTVYDKSVYEAELDQFETYAFGDMMNLSEESQISTNEALNKMVENSIAYEMDVYNYDMDEESPDMLVNYMLFDEDYNEQIGYMPGFRIDEDFGMDDNILDEIKDGSLMVSIISTENGKVVWSGYVVDGIDVEASPRQQQKDARQVVSAAIESFVAATNFEDIPTTSTDEGL